MATDSERDWKSRFAPPPPPPLKSAPRSQPAQVAEPEPASEPAAGRGSDRDPVADQVPEAGRRRLAPVPVAATPDAHTPAPREEVAAAQQPTTTAERDQATRLVAAIAAAGLEGHLVGLRRNPAGNAYDVDLGSPDAVQDLVLKADDLAQTLGADEVRVARRANPTVVRVEVRRAAGAEDPAKQMAVWVPVEVRDAVNAERKRSDETLTEFFLGAFNRQYAKLDTFFARRVPSAGPMPVSRSRRHRRGIATPVQLWLYLTEEQREILDDAVEQSGAGSRSDLVTKMLQEDLGLNTGAGR